MRFNHKAYFDNVRVTLFDGTMSQQQVDGQEFILDAWEKHISGHDLRWLAYFLATAYHETAKEMWPIEEYGKGKGMDYGEPDPETGEAYYGRGDVMLTWADNYRRADSEFGWEDDKSCYLHPELQLDPTVSARTGYLGMQQGWFRAPNTFELYFNEQESDAYGAREIINGDKSHVPSWSNGVSIGKLVEGYYEKFLDALRAAAVEEPIIPPIPQPPDWIRPVPGRGESIDIAITGTANVTLSITYNGQTILASKFIA